MANKMTFMGWLYTNLEKQNPVGDLARDAKDAKVPLSGDFKILRKSMFQYGYMEVGPVYDAVQEAKRGYKIYLRT